MSRLYKNGESLSEEDFFKFRDSLLEAFTPTSFDEMLLSQFSIKRDQIITETLDSLEISRKADNFEIIVSLVVTNAEMKRWTKELLHACLMDREKTVRMEERQQLINFAKKFKMV